MTINSLKSCLIQALCLVDELEHAEKGEINDLETYLETMKGDLIKEFEAII